MSVLRSMVRQALAAVRAFLVLSLLLGLLYPLAFTGLAQVIAPRQANGSLVTSGGRIVGSALLGQVAPGPQWFQSRPSDSDYAGDTSGSSNLSPMAAKHLDAVAQRRRDLEKDNPGATGPIPADALSASSSGLDPHISPEYAAWQAPRVARSRSLPLSKVEELITEHTQGRSLGFLGSPRVNVTELNLALANAG
ncbi:potassium-transporting ATPase subunit KdpC [Gephyromycinifex aptenodytis]|uniref:potassium-transporting ATPase subunit KdpC n=1 Tax=Gephyromycinifex aptenodytis TaxID=2716227 RepID=UPI0029C9F7EA|nr:potassium-transporting ATPase subunit KdpC [Gephyromycinifex aptenodytis]